MKKALITGANKGIGFETARHLLQQGYFVYLGSRNPSLGADAIAALKAEGLASCDVIELDVTDALSVEKAAQTVAAKTATLDVLINNAGILGQFPAPAGEDGVLNTQQVFATNYLGAIRITTALLPLLQKAAQPRIVNVSSEVASLTLHQDPAWMYYAFKDAAYVPSKTALNLYTMMLAFQLKDTAFKVNSVCPGYTRTALNNFTADGDPADAARIVARYAMLDEEGPTGQFFNAAGALPW
ncbi:SDR family NAD(P)-dependent oxidoreductase [Chitinophaga agrisoli]|uniref:SDR family NAD(P)-dependent oxidoreductase n=1 Tax=Chitinophaga agrisoli TaxID=2607653 RepID=A0A5B2VXB1_9BACT|nr:SDR family NAD(P)-dependent oxidoreductase [Chitinophaga agrisoli]KAA2243240.1 SDR family NAD(P)-dependent oxidoreductase [Chitinophaga agrisoli]